MTRRAAGALLMAALLLTGLALTARAPRDPGIAPPPSACTGVAPERDSLNTAIAATPESSDPLATPGVLPEGEPADAVTSAAVAATVRALVGCYNAGAPLRTFGLFTDAYLHRLYDRQGGFSAEAYAFLATPAPEPEARWTRLVAIEGVRVLPDGRVGAMVTLRYASVPMPKRFFFVFAPVDGVWRIDAIKGEISFAVP